MPEETTVMIAAGGTGGHIFPGLAVAEVLTARGARVVWLGSQRGPEQDWTRKAGIPFEGLSIAGLRGKGVAGWPAAPWRIGRAVRQAMAIMGRYRPRSVLALGGFAAGPGGIAAALRRTPLVVHEQNAVAGLTSKTLARFAREVLSAFPDALPRAQVVGNPVRADIAAIPAPAERFAGRTEPKRLLVLGGSQGSRRLNLWMPEALAQISSEARVRVRHQCGARHEAETREAYAKAGIEAEVHGFMDAMAEAYAWADLVLARAGALTLAELAAAGVGALLVPYPYAVDDHQAMNGRFWVDAGAAHMRREETLDADALAAELRSLLASRERLLSMAEAARRLAKPAAAELIADACLRG